MVPLGGEAVVVELVSVVVVGEEAEEAGLAA